MVLTSHFLIDIMENIMHESTLRHTILKWVLYVYIKRGTFMLNITLQLYSDIVPLSS